MTLLRCLPLAIVLSWFASGVAASPLPPTLTIDQSLGKIAGWSIGFSGSIGGCVAAAAFGDGTTLWFGITGERGAFLAFSNARWQSIVVGGSYDISMTTHRKRWRGTFVGFEHEAQHGVFQAGLNDGFIEEMSDSDSIDVRYGGKMLARLSLVGSTEAMSGVAACQKSTSRTAKSDARPDHHRLEAGMASMGTGFFVSAQGHVLTNNHVVEDCREYRVRRPGQSALPAHVVATDASNDLAVLSTDAPQKFVPALSVRARVGESIFVYGFPQPDTLASTGNFTIGNVTATAGMRDDTRDIQISAPVHMGNSGGPVLDKFGNVVGVIQSKASAVAFGESHDVPQNVNFAIKSTIALNFLEANGVEASIAVRNDAPMDAEAVADFSKIFVVQVVCQ